MTVFKLNKIQNKNYLNLFEIKPSFLPPCQENESFNTFVSSLEELLEKILHNFFADIESEENTFEGFNNLSNALPIVYYSDLDRNNYFSFCVLCDGDFSQGIGRFVTDMLSKWLIPGKQLSIHANRSLGFNFSHFPQKNLYLTQCYVVFDEKDLTSIKSNIEPFIHQLRLIILAVFHSRSIISQKKLSEEEKSHLIQENISSLLDFKQNSDVFDHFQHFFMKLSAEKNLSQIRENLDRLMNKNPKFYDRDIFDSIYNISLIFLDSFTALREPHFVSRLISFYYLFKKTVKHKTFLNPSERHINFKIFKTRYNQKDHSQTVGILLSMNLIEETERFDQAHMVQALKSCIGDIKYVKSSFLSDKRDPKFISFYLEIEKLNLSNFSIKELSSLKKKLPLEIKERIETSISPIFMPRNEEEIIRNIILLSKQLQYVKDIPQVIISYEKQTSKDISFTVILLRLLKKGTLPLKDLFSSKESFLKFFLEEVKIIASLKKKYSKEANVFKVLIPKSSFYRKDFSLDLQKARQTVVVELAKVIGDFRDYNGGMILKQNQALETLKQLLETQTKEKNPQIENFFYSIKPGIMQSIIDPKILKALFLLFGQISAQDISENSFLIKTISMPKYMLIVIKASSFDFKEQIENLIEDLKIASFDLTSCQMEEGKNCSLGYIYRCSNLSRHNFFYNSVLNCMKDWESKKNKKG